MELCSRDCRELQGELLGVADSTAGSLEKAASEPRLLGGARERDGRERVDDVPWSQTGRGAQGLSHEGLCEPHRRVWTLH